jgi:predicted alpha/beta hydrolase
MSSSKLRWSESMRGRVSFDTTDYNQGWWQGTPCAFHLDLRVDDVERFFTDDDHEASCAGWIDCDGLGERMAITEGSFNLLVADGDPRRREMRYRLFADDAQGRPFTLAGVKYVEDGWFRDTWVDTTTLLTRLYTGRVTRDDEDGAVPMAAGVMHVSAGGFLALVLSMRGPLRDRLRYGSFFTRSLLQVYVGREHATGSTDFPGLHPGSERWQGFPPEEWHDCPGRPGLRRRILAVRTDDGRDLTVHHIRGAAEPSKGPVLLQHGTGVRANLFYGSPMERSIVDVLVDDGYDVWLGNWRGSIDLPECDYTLDEVARFDHPALVAAVLRETGARTLKAIVHCQGSTSFALACSGGLVPEVTDVVSNAVSFHVDVPRLSKLQMQVLIPLLAPGYPGFDPQWTIRPTALRARLLANWARLVRRECREPVCQMANYTYGVGGNILWDHANIDPPTHRWIAREFGWVPTSFFQQMSRCASAGHLVAASGFDELPDDVVSAPPRNRPRWTFLAGAANRCFLARSQERSFAWLDALEPGRHALVELPGYTHLDVFFGRDAPRDVFGHIVAGLDGTSVAAGS